MHKLECFLENEMHKIIWDSKIQMDPIIPARRLYFVLINKKKSLPPTYILSFSWITE